MVSGKTKKSSRVPAVAASLQSDSLRSSGFAESDSPSSFSAVALPTVCQSDVEVAPVSPSGLVSVSGSDELSGSASPTLTQSGTPSPVCSTQCSCPVCEDVIVESTREKAGDMALQCDTIDSRYRKRDWQRSIKLREKITSC